MYCSKCGAPLPYGTYGNVKCEHCNCVTYVPTPEEKREGEREWREKSKEEPTPVKVEAPPPKKAKKGGIFNIFGKLIIFILILFVILVFIGVLVDILDTGPDDDIIRDNDIIIKPTLPPKTTPPTTMPPRTTAPPTTFLVSDPFDLNTYGWPMGTVEGDYAKLVRSLTNGKYRWEVLAHQSVHSYAYPNLEQVSDFYLTVDAKLYSGTTNSAYGVVFRLVDAKNFYDFSISDAKMFQFRIMYGGEWITLIDWTSTSAIRPGEVNRIEIIAEGPQFSFFINDQFVTWAEDDRLTSGNTGLSIGLYEAGDQGVFEFDNFELDAYDFDDDIQEPEHLESEYIASWEDETNGIYSVYIWEMLESDFIYEKGKAEEGGTIDAGIGNKFIVLGVTVAKERDTSTSWPLAFEIVDGRDKHYKEYTLDWRVAGYLDKDIDVGESNLGVLVFQIPEQMKAAKLYCRGCSGTTSGVVDVTVDLQ